MKSHYIFLIIIIGYNPLLYQVVLMHRSGIALWFAELSVTTYERRKTFPNRYNVISVTGS